MEDFDTAFTPTTLKLKHVGQILWIMLGILGLLTFTTTITYIVSCYMDNEIPIDVLNMTIDDTVVGQPMHYHFDGYRKRYSCQVDVYRYAVDAKGQIIYSYQDSRPTNGYNRRYIIDDDYKMNGKETPGTATFHIFFKWTCPNNLVHLWRPLTKDYSDSFEIYASEKDKEEGKKTIYTPPPIEEKK